MKRREFIKTGALLVVGTTAAASTLITQAGADIAPALAVLNPHQAQTLLRMARLIFPHKQLGDAPYWKVVADLDSAAKADPAVAKLMVQGVEQLDHSAGGKFVDLGKKRQVALLKAIDKGPFFQKVRGVELVTLYSDPAVWKSLGYPGGSYRYGGYLHRGFNDLAWLPNPPESASPKPA
jgi:Gluconate 2-dehydrogenase subunit 3